jgi:hypothetical protein
MRVSTSGPRAHSEQNGASGLRRETTTDDAVRRDYERRVRELLDALEARLLHMPPEDRFAAIDAVAAAVKYGRQVTISVKPFTVRF